MKKEVKITRIIRLSGQHCYITRKGEPIYCDFYEKLGDYITSSVAYCHFFNKDIFAGDYKEGNIRCPNCYEHFHHIPSERVMIYMFTKSDGDWLEYFSEHDIKFIKKPAKCSRIKKIHSVNAK